MRETGKCPNCGAEIIQATQIKQYYCLNCGAALDEERKRKEADARRRRQDRDVKESPLSTSFGKFFYKVKEVRRDKTRDYLCATLQSMGVDAEIARRGRPEEQMSGGGSLGLIEIFEGPIRWVDVRRLYRHAGEETVYFYDYGVPDSRLQSNAPGVEIESKRKRDNWQWRGTDAGLGIIGRLNGDISIEYTLIRTKTPKVTIRTYTLPGCWVISSEAIGMLSQELWNCYQAIAKHLLSAPLCRR